MKTDMSFKERQKYGRQKIRNNIMIDCMVSPRETKKKIVEYRKQRSLQEWWGVDDTGVLGTEVNYEK